MDSHTVDGPIGLEALDDKPQWMAFAACRDEPLMTFFPDRGGSVKRAHDLRWVRRESRVPRLRHGRRRDGRHLGGHI
jgi:hypothetical protein